MTYVNNGGSVISSFDTGSYDENGEPAGISQISELQGVKAFSGFVKYKPGCGY